MKRQARAVRTREKILTAAAGVFADRGYGPATISEILVRAGVTKGALYFHFASKDELAQGVMSIQLDVPPLPPQQLKLQELVDYGMVHAFRLRHEPLVQAAVGLAMDAAVERSDRCTSFRAWVGRVEQLLVAARESHELLAHVDTTDTAELFAGAFSGIQEMSDVVTQRADLAHRVVVLLRHVLPSIATPAAIAALDLGADRAERVLELVGGLGPVGGVHAEDASRAV